MKWIQSPLKEKNLVWIYVSFPKNIFFQRKPPVRRCTIMNLDECVLFILFSLLFIGVPFKCLLQIFMCFEWIKKKKVKRKVILTEAENEDILHSTPTLKRRKSDDSTITKYIICNMQYHNKSKKRFRFSSHKNLCLQQRRKIICS